MPRHPSPPRLIQRDEPGRPAFYYITWIENGRRRRRSTGTADARQAARILAQFRADIRPDLSATPLDEILIADILEDYARHAAGRAAAADRIGYGVMRLLPFWGSLPVTAARERQARQYAAERQAAGVSLGTIRRELGILAAALSHAVRSDILPERPALWLPPRPPGRARFLTRGELAAMIRAARAEPQTRHHLPLFILLGFYTGARKASILALQWQPNRSGGHIDLAAGLIDFNPIGRQPTQKRRARIPIPPELRRILAARSRLGASHVVADRSGRPLANIRRGFTMAAAAAGVPWAVPHTLRHTCITHLMIAGVAAYDVAAWCAISLAEIERTYGHHAPGYLASTAAARQRSRRPQ